jgi:hypothetical protein
LLRRRQVVRLPVSHTVKLAGNCAEVFKSNLAVTYFICKLHMQN